MYFQKVGEPKSVKDRVHLDLAPTRDRDPDARSAAVAAEVRRLVEAGATEIGRREDFDSAWTIMHDPEDNEFCVH